MLIAGYNGAYGNAEKTTPVKSAVMLLGTLPRVLSVNEEVNLPVSVFGGDADIKNAQIVVSTNELMEVIGNKMQTTDVKRNQEQLLNFKVKVKSATGIGKVTIVATAGTKKTHYQIELDVRNPNPYRTEVQNYLKVHRPLLNSIWPAYSGYLPPSICSWHS